MYTQTKTQLAELFREWFNDYLTVKVFAEHKGIPENKAYRLINAGRKAHNLGCRNIPNH